MSDLSDRVMMRLAEGIADTLFGDLNEEARNTYVSSIAAALSSHGLREMVQALVKAKDHGSWKTTVTCFEVAADCSEALIVALGEGEKLKTEEQVDE